MSTPGFSTWTDEQGVAKTGRTSCRRLGSVRGRTSKVWQRQGERHVDAWVQYVDGLARCGEDGENVMSTPGFSRWTDEQGVAKTGRTSCRRLGSVGGRTSKVCGRQGERHVDAWVQ